MGLALFFCLDFGHPTFRLGFGIFRRRSGRHGRVPVEEAGATVAGEQLALAELVPHLGTNTHTAAGALLIVNAGQSGAARTAKTVEANKHFRLDERTEGFTLDVECGKFMIELSLAKCDAGPRVVESGNEQLNLSAGSDQRGFLSFRPLQAGKILGFKAFGFGFGKMEFMFQGRSLLGSGDGILLGTAARSFFAMGVDFAVKAGAKRLFRAKGSLDLDDVGFGSRQCSSRLDHFGWQGTQG